MSNTTMAEISSEAGLSVGIVNLHFKSKERLLIETLRHVTVLAQIQLRVHLILGV